MGAEIELLWLTDEVRRDRPSVLDEVSSVIWYLEDRLLDASVQVSESAERAFQLAFGEPLGFSLRLPMGSWVAGDRDGNPFVTPEITMAAARRTAHALLGLYHRKLWQLVQRLSVSDRLGGVPDVLRQSLERDKPLLPKLWEMNRKRDEHEPLRLKLTCHVRQAGSERGARSPREIPDRSNAWRVPTPRPKNFGRDLDVVRQALVHARAELARRSLLDPLIGQVEVLGFAGYYLDLREDSEMHTRTLAAIAKAVGVPELDDAAIHRELLGLRPLVSAYAPLDEEAARTSKLFHTMREVQDEFGERAAQTYIVSMTKTSTDLLRVLILAREAGLVDLAREEPFSRLDVVPLFETQADLFNGPFDHEEPVRRSGVSAPAQGAQDAPRGDARLFRLREGRRGRGRSLGAISSTRGLGRSLSRRWRYADFVPRPRRHRGPRVVARPCTARSRRCLQAPCPGASRSPSRARSSPRSSAFCRSPSAAWR